MKSTHFDLAENETTVFFPVIAQYIFLLFQSGRQHYDFVEPCLVTHILEKAEFFPLINVFFFL